MIGLTNAPKVRSIPSATTRDPNVVISPSSDGSVMKLEAWSDSKDRSMVDMSGGSRQSSKIGVTASPS